MYWDTDAQCLCNVAEADRDDTNRRREKKKRLKCYLKEAGMALQLCGAEGPHWTETGPQMDVGDQGAGREQETRRSLRFRTETVD